MTTALQGVEVEMTRLDRDWRQVGFVVKVHLHRKGKLLKATNEIDPLSFPNAQALSNAIGVAAGACAEYLGKKYGANIDPHEAARLGIKAFTEELLMQNELKKDIPAKLLRIAGHRQTILNAQEMELLERFQHTVQHDLPLTPKEAVVLDIWIARIHEQSH